jgi:ADP-heptose:LPS heptosyltransferase
VNPHAVRRLDSWLGKPVCFALTVLRRIGALFAPARRDIEPSRKILLIKMIEQGATVLAYRAIARAVEMVGRENVYFWVFDENRFILDLLELIPRENVLVVRTRNPLVLLWDLLATAWRARGLEIDATVDMEFFSRASAILAFLTNARRRVGLHRFTSEGPYRGDLMTHRVQYNPYLHTAAAYYLLVEALLADPTEVPLMKVPVPAIDFMAPRFQPAQDEVERVQSMLNRVAGRDVSRPIVLLNPNASDMLPLRRWPTERFVELGQRIAREHPEVTIAITGAPSEQQEAQWIAEAIGPHGRVISLAGHTTLRELIVLYTLADVLVTNDSGPGHFASLTDIMSVVLFGPETPAVFGPLGAHTRAVRTDIACSPCVNAMNHRFSPCNNNVCMQMISVDQVYELVHERLDRRPRLELRVVAGGQRQNDFIPNAVVE